MIKLGVSEPWKNLIFCKSLVLFSLTAFVLAFLLSSSASARISFSFMTSRFSLIAIHHVW